MTDQTTAPAGVVSSTELGGTATWYEVLMYYGTDTLATINAVQVLHETEHQIVLAGVAKVNARRRKVDGYFRTWSEAHQYLIDKAEKELTDANAKLQRAKTRYYNVTRLQPNTTNEPRPGVTGRRQNRASALVPACFKFQKHCSTAQHLCGSAGADSKESGPVPRPIIPNRQHVGLIHAAAQFSTHKAVTMHPALILLALRLLGARLRLGAHQNEISGATVSSTKTSSHARKKSLI